MSKHFYLTTPLYHVNGLPHVGHATATILADAIARYKRMTGVEVCALTGTDEHGLKTERKARALGVSPSQLSDTYSGAFKQAWQRLGLHFDQFVRTTGAEHPAAVRELFRRIKANKFVYLGEYRGSYCGTCEAYAAETQKICGDCGSPTESVAEETYFFRLSAFQEKLLNFYQDNPDFVVPPNRMNEVVSLVKGGLDDLSISRTSFAWGIRIPDDEKHIFYVWFDALTAYLSGVGFPHDTDRFRRFWPADVQLVPKDTLRFHAVYWPAFLMAAGLEPPRHILTHGGWTVYGEKISEAKGNFITVDELTELVPPDYVKYFVLRETPLGADGDFSYEALVDRVNSDLANDLGNLAGRILKMIDNYFQGTVPEPGEPEGGDEGLQRFTRETWQLYREYFDHFQITKALDSLRELISVVSKYVVANEPWALAREQSKRLRLATVLYHAAEALRIIATMFRPVIPEGSAAILEQMGTSQAGENQKPGVLKWGELKPGTRIRSADAVCARLELSDIDKRRSQWREREAQSARELRRPAAQGEIPEITIEDFAKVEMRVAKILSAERVPGSEKLVKMQVDIGSETRQIVAGIGKAYTPESLPGRLVVVVANLKPAKLMGVVSNGMIVAASEGGIPVLATFAEPVVVGSRLK